jgi:hypothetical protein
VVRDGADRLPVFEVRVGRADGPMLATLHAEGPAAPEVVEGLRYDPGNTGPDLQPRGALNRLRQPTYAAGQKGRGAPVDGGADRRTSIMRLVADDGRPSPSPSPSDGSSSDASSA